MGPKSVGARGGKVASSATTSKKQKTTHAVQTTTEETNSSSANCVECNKLLAKLEEQNLEIGILKLDVSEKTTKINQLETEIAELRTSLTASEIPQEAIPAEHREILRDHPNVRFITFIQMWCRLP